MRRAWLRAAWLLPAVLLASLVFPAAAQKPKAPATSVAPATAKVQAPATVAQVDTHAGDELAIGREGRYVLSRSFSYLEDAGGELVLADLLKPEAQARFQPVPQTGPATNFGLTRSAIWLRVTLRPERDAPADWMLELAYPPLDRLELYAPDGKGGFSRQVGGDLSPFAERAVVHRNHVMPLRLKPGAASTLYLRVSSGGTVSAPVNLSLIHI